MPGIRSYARTVIREVPSAFPAPSSPAYVHTDFPYSTSPVNWGANDGMLCLPSAELIMPAPYRVPHNQKLDVVDSSNPEVREYPSVEWATFGDNQATLRYAYAYPYLYAEVGIEQFDGQPDREVHARSAVNCQGFSFLFRRTDSADMSDVGGEPASDAPPGSLIDSDDLRTRGWEIRWTMGTGEDEHGYALTFPGIGSALLQYWNPALGTAQSAYSSIKEINGGDDVAKALWGNFASDGQYTSIEVLVAGGKMYISQGSQDTPVMIDAARIGKTGNPMQRILRVEVSSVRHKTFYWAVHPVKFLASTSHDSVSFPIGFKSYSFPSWKTEKAGGWADLGDSSAVVSEVEDGSLYGPNCQYRLQIKLPITGTFKGRSYADFAPGYRAIHLHWPRGPLVYGTDAPYDIYPEAVSVSQVFNTDSLQIRSNATISLNNTRGQWGLWSQTNGQKAVRIGMTRTALQGGVISGVPDYKPVFTGYAHTSGTVDLHQGGGVFVMACDDRTRQLSTPRWALPWMDGWNSIYAIAYLAQLGGVPISDMAFASFVPDTPFGDLGDPSGTLANPSGGAYFLPVGYYSTTLTRFSGEGLWQIMSKIAYSIGYMLYFDVYGILHFHKFWLPFFDNGILFPIKRTFFESDMESSLPGSNSGLGGAEGCWSIRSHKSMETVRNKAVVVGVNAFSPAWEPIVMTATDYGSIFTPGSSNYLGYIQPVVWAENQFADPAYAWQACVGLLQFLRMPERKISLTTWFQPDLNPLDCIALYSRRTGTIGLKFMITAVSHQLNAHSQMGSTSIEATAMSTLDGMIDDWGVAAG